MALAVASKSPAHSLFGLSTRIQQECDTRRNRLTRWPLLTIILFLSVFLVSQTYSLLQSTQASQVKAESFKDERESSRKEFSPPHLETFLASLLARQASDGNFGAAVFVIFDVAFQHLQLSDILLISQSSPRAPPL